jgi:single-stranded-DNA-specific exonuclease
MKHRWTVAPPQPALAAALARELGRSPLLIQCLLNRGLSEPGALREFLQPRLKHLADPFLLPDMAAAVQRLFLARERGERLVLFGDYDVDGVTSTALLVEVLRALGWRVDSYLPRRLEEGYGLSREGVENCLSQFPATLLLAVDCGSTAVETIAWLRERGVDVIVLDHHQVSCPAPAALALVNPQRGDGFCQLCSAGLAFKLAHALVKQGRAAGLAGAEQLDLRAWLDLVALGTIADLVPLTGENRILVAAGLKRLNQGGLRPGLAALREVAGVNGPIGTYEAGYQFVPRLNAAGRLETAEQALQLLLARTMDEARPLARQLDACNRERQKIERSIFEEARGAVKARFDPERDFVIVEGHLLWHVGVVGIVAARVLREFYRPTVIFGGDAAEWRGSGRSIEGFDLAAALRECDDLLLRHGGHAMAAGLSIHPDRLEALRTRLNDLARRTLRAELLQPALRLDAEVNLADLTVERLGELDLLAPAGQHNPPVQLCARGLQMQRAPARMGREQQHARFTATDGSHAVEVVCWNVEDAQLPSGRFDLAFTPQLNEFRDERRVQLKLLDWRPA